MWEIAKSRVSEDSWHVEFIDHEGDGDCYVTIFAGRPQKKEQKNMQAGKTETLPTRSDTNTL
jgi:hypothetical protein